MTRLRRRSRAVYRVYGEEEYLAGADIGVGPLPEWEHMPRSEEPAHGRRLQRLAGAAALSGAVGTVGGVVGLAGLRSHAVAHREIAQRVAPPTRAAVSRRHASALVPAHVARRRMPHPPPSRRTRARRVSTPPRVSLGQASRAETAARAIATSAPQANAAQHAPPAEVHAGARAQSEFGFER